MHVLFFGTYDERTHPRARTLREGMLAHGAQVSVTNAPLGLDTAARVRIASHPVLVPGLLWRLARCWAQLLVRARGARPDVVVVGYLGVFDVLLARLRFRRSTVVLDAMVTLADTVHDRRLGRAWLPRLLSTVDRAAFRAAHIVLVDTEAQQATLPEVARARSCVVPVGAPWEWFETTPQQPDGPLRVVFFGLYTPLQGAPTIGEALARLDDAPIHTTMVGHGQDRQATARAAGGSPSVRWVDWVPSERLAELVAGHDVCLGIFGTGDKAKRVVPNKAFQGAATGCLVVTSDTPEQRRALGELGCFVPPGDPAALASLLRDLSARRRTVREARDARRSRAATAFSPAAITEALVQRLHATRQPA